MREEHQSVRRRHGPSLWERLRWNLGWFAAVGLAAVLGLQVAGLVLRPSADAAAALTSLRDVTSSVDGNVAGRTFPEDERLKELEERIGRIRTALKHEKPAVPAVSALTYPLSYLKTLEPGESNEIRFPAPIGLSAVAEAGGVDLKWSEAADANLKAGSYEIFRSEGDSALAPLGKVLAPALTFRDATALPGHRYTYAVLAVAADAELASTPRGRSAMSDPASVRAVADFKIEILAARGKSLTVKVSKWHEGAWRDRLFDVAPGEAVGRPDPALGVDFSTKRVVSKVDVETESIPVTRPEVVFDPDGRVVVEGGAAKRVPVATTVERQRTRILLTGAGLPDETVVVEGP